MALKKTIARLNDYVEKLGQNKAGTLKAKHVDKILTKLQAKEEALSQAIQESDKPGRKHRLKRKRKMIRDQIERAKLLRREMRKAN